MEKWINWALTLVNGNSGLDIIWKWDYPMSSMAISGGREECSISSHFIGLEGFWIFCSSGPADVGL